MPHHSKGKPVVAGRVDVRPLVISAMLLATALVVAMTERAQSGPVSSSPAHSLSSAEGATSASFYS